MKKYKKFSVIHELDSRQDKNLVVSNEEVW